MRRRQPFGCTQPHRASGSAATHVCVCTCIGGRAPGGGGGACAEAVYMPVPFLTGRAGSSLCLQCTYGGGAASLADVDVRHAKSPPHPTPPHTPQGAGEHDSGPHPTPTPSHPNRTCSSCARCSTPTAKAWTSTPLRPSWSACGASCRPCARRRGPSSTSSKRCGGGGACACACAWQAGHTHTKRSRGGRHAACAF